MTIEQVTAFMRSLGRLRLSRGWLYGRDSVVFEGIGQRGRIEHRLRLPRYEADVLLRQLRGVVPGLRTTLIPEPALPKANWLRRIHLTTTARPVRTDVAGDFAVSLLNTLQPLLQGETLAYQLVVFPVATPSWRPPDGPAPQLLPPWLQHLVQLLLAAPPPPSGPRALAGLQAKTAEPWFGVVGTVGAAAVPRSRAHLLAGRVMAALHLLDQDGAALVPRWLPARAHRWLARAATSPPLGRPAYVNAKEAATLVAWPVSAPTVPGLELTGSRLFPPVRSLPTTGRVIGNALYDGQPGRPVAISATDSLMHHLITGSTGTGKSTLLLNLLTQDMRAGRAVVLIDPGGDLARDVVDQVPAERLDDLIVLDAADARPVGLNPLDCEPADAELVADQVLEILRAHAESWGPRLEEILKSSLVLLAATPGMTLVELPLLLTDGRFRRQLLAGLDPVFQPTVGRFFARFESWTDGERDQAVSAVLNKVSPLTDRRQLRAILGQSKPWWSIQEVIDNHKILVVSLPSGQIGSLAADLLGSLVVQMLWNAAQRRSAVAREQRQLALLYVDEAARFLRNGVNLADMLARARGSYLGIVAVLQHLGQVPAWLRAALLSEARTKTAFQPGPDDAATLAKTFGPPVKPEDLLNLDARTALAAVVVGGHASPVVTISTSPPPHAMGRGPAVLEASRQQYGRTVADVEQEIASRQSAGDPGPRGHALVP
ncbi:MULTISPECIES: type IV secretion system DNA-binding domain-containing protein [Kitasatospora]|uniref:type IV secretory system conjugative DNA transfer family protein n=1 Tax=Kitasatospora TaxID=2063 RepID=UPI00052783C3|nr:MULTISPECIES: type IV secretion system DNA-binding domain-containing protein [Kitasatospora]